MIATGMDPTVIAAAIVTVIAALVGGTVTVVNAIAAAQDRKDARSARFILQNTTDGVTHKADTIIEKAIEIHTLTNSNLSKVTESLNIALEKISGLEKLVTSLTAAKQVADALASSPPSPAVAAVGALESLVKIDTNTKAIEKNTARTDAAVADLGTKPKSKV